MRVVRVGPLPDRAIEAAAAFHAGVLPGILAHLDPPRNGQWADAPQGGDAPSVEPSPEASLRLLPRTSDQPDRASTQDLVLIFAPASHDHRGWRLAAVQDLARAAAPARLNAIVGDDEEAIAESIAWLEGAPGVTGQVLAVGR